MADNTTLAVGAGGDVVRDKDRAGVKTQIVGLDVGIAGTEQLMASAALADATANPTIPAWASMAMLYNGATWDRVRGDTTNGLDVDVTRMAPLVAGTANIGDVDVLTVPAPLSTTGGGTEATAHRVTLANDSTGVITAKQATAANLKALVDQGTAAASAGAWPAKVTDGTNVGAVKAASTAAAATDPSQVVSISPNNEVGVIELPAAAAAADGLTNPTISQIGADTMLFNGATWDREHGNWRTTTGDTGAKTVTFNGATQTNFDARGAFIVIRLGTVSGTTPTMACQLQVSSDAGTTWFNLGPPTANVTTSNQQAAIMIYPTAWAQTTPTPAALVFNANQTAFINAPLMRTWRIGYTIGGTTPSFTITAVDVSYQL